MSFFTDVQKGKISSPVHRSYSRSAWENSYAEMRKTLDCDRIFNAGKIIFRVLDSLRTANSSIPKWCETGKHIKYLIGLSNRDTVVMTQLMRDRLHDLETPFMNDLEHFKVPLNTGQMVKPDEISSSSGDALTTVILDVLSNSSASVVHGLSDLEKLHLLAAQVNLCNTYQWLESIWRDCLWNGYEFADDGASGYYIEPHSETARSIAMATATSSYRRKMFQTNRLGLIGEIWNRQLSDVVKARLSTTEFVAAVSGSGKSRSIRLSSGKYEELEDKARFEAFATKDLVQHEYYEDILSRPVSKLGGENVTRLFDVWLVLRSLSRASAARIPDSSVVSPNTLLSFAPSFPRKELVGVVCRATKAPIEKIKPLLEFLTFRRRGHTLWSQPLLECENDRLLLPFATLHQSDPLYVLECWLPMLSLDIGAKGNPFEQQVRTSLQEADKSPLIQDIFSVFDGELTFHPNSRGERNEEIDLIFLVNKTLYIGEIKCSVVPIEDINFHNNRSILNGAAEQALRKSACVQRNLSTFSNQLKKLGFVVPSDANVKPLIISNNLINSGYPVKGVPVVDIPILERYLEGSLTELSYRAGLEPLQITHFYTSPDEAEQNIDAYFSNPPQLRHFKPSLRMRELEVPANLFSERLPRLRSRTYEVIVDVEEVKKRLAADDLSVNSAFSDSGE